MTQFRRWLLLIPLLVGTQLSTGCYLGLTSRPVLFPNVALSPAYVRPGGVSGGPCAPACYRPFGDGPSLLGGAGYGGGVPVVSGPVYDAPPAGCTTCGSGHGIPIAGGPGGPPIAVSPPVMIPSGGVPGGPIYGVPFDSGTVVPTVKPPVGSVPLQMPSEVKESKKLVSAK